MRRSASLFLPAALLLLLPLVRVTGIAPASWGARYAAVTGIAILAIPLLLALAFKRDPGAILALGFVGWSGFSAVRADVPELAVWGRFGWGTGLMFVLALAGFWSIGRYRRVEESRDLAAFAFVAGALVNVAMAAAQSAFDLSRFSIADEGGRASGLLGNPVYLGSISAAAFWVCAHLVRSKALASFLLCAVMAAGVQMSGTRAAVAVLLLAAAASPVRFGRRGVGPAIAAVVGLVLAPFIVGAEAPTGTDRAAATATVDAAAEDPRPHVWRAAGEAIGEQPTFGAGPGRFQSAQSPHRSLAEARIEGHSTLYVDAHNIFVEYATTTGLVGLALFVGWVLVGARAADWSSPLAGAAAALLLLHLVQPQNVVTTPLMFLLLGLAAPATADLVPLKALLAVTSLLGTVVAGWLLVGFFHLNQARLDLDLRHAKRAQRLLPPWPEVAEQHARSIIFDGLERGDRSARRRARPLREEAARRDPADPGPMFTLADFQIQLGDRKAAREGLAAALDQNPWSVPALNTAGRLALAEGDPLTAIPLLRRSLLVLPDQRGTRAALAHAEALASGTRRG